MGQFFVADLGIETNLTAIVATATILSADGKSGAPLPSAQVRFDVHAEPGQAPLATAVMHTGGCSELGVCVAALEIPSPRLWSPDSPFLYNLTATLAIGQQDVDEVTSYFGMRTVSLGDAPAGAKTLQLNGAPLFASGWLDQSWWPDGQYTAPTDEALAFDVQALATFGMNMVRLHQKINPERWYQLQRFRLVLSPSDPQTCLAEQVLPRGQGRSRRPPGHGAALQLPR